jgi:uncharacterized membrane protein YfcA
VTLDALGELFSPATWFAAIALGAVAGIVRGVTGFGAAMVMSPPLALLLGPSVAVPLVLILEGFAAAPMLPGLRRQARWRLLAPILIAASAFLPVGVYLLTHLDRETTRRMIALFVIGFSLMLLAGLRWRGPYRMRTSLGLGALSGAMVGTSGIGAPPIILYLLAGSDQPATVRATMTFYVALISIVALTVFLTQGLITKKVLVLSVAMTPLFMLGVNFGGRIFARLSEERFRKLTIWLMLTVSVMILIV